MSTGVSVGEGLNEGVEVVLGETYLEEGGLPDAVDGVREVVFYL